MHCPVCGTDTSTAGFPHRPGDGCAHRPSFLDQIPVVEVLEEVLDLLDQRTHTGQARQRGSPPDTALDAAAPPPHRGLPGRQLALVAGHVVYGAVLAEGLRTRGSSCATRGTGNLRR